MARGRQTRGEPVDTVLLAAIAGLLVIGLVMVMSASSVTGHMEFGDPYAYAKRQALWVLLGLVAMAICMRLDYRVFRPLARPGLLLCLALLALVLVVGSEVGGARRWISLGGFNLQPSELAKLGVANYLAAFAAGRRDGMAHLWKGLVPALVVALAATALILLEPDFGTAAVLLGTSMLVLFAAGAQWSHLLGVALLGLPAAGVLVWMEPYRMRRLMAFIDPWADKMDSGWNVIQSLLAIGSGGLFGLGLGEGRQKYLYVPEQHTDFIFAILGEELGFIGGALVLFLFFLIAWRGYRAALRAPDVYGCLLAVGITSLVVFQSLLNIGVVTGSLPVTGITLPFISFGGSSLMVTLAGMGVLLNIARQGGQPAMAWESGAATAGGRGRPGRTWGVRTS